MGAQRSLAKTGDSLGLKRETIEEISARWGWVSRVAAYDDDVAREAERVARKDTVERQEAMHARHRQAGQRGQMVVTFPMLELMKRMSAAGQKEYAAKLREAESITDEKKRDREVARVTALYDFSGLSAVELARLGASMAGALQTFVAVERGTEDLPDQTIAHRAAINVGDADRPAPMPAAGTKPFPPRDGPIDPEVLAIIDAPPANVTGGYHQDTPGVDPGL